MYIPLWPDLSCGKMQTHMQKEVALMLLPTFSNTTRHQTNHRLRFAI